MLTERERAEARAVAEVTANALAAATPSVSGPLTLKPSPRK